MERFLKILVVKNLYKNQQWKETVVTKDVNKLIIPDMLNITIVCVNDLYKQYTEISFDMVIDMYNSEKCIKNIVWK